MMCSNWLSVYISCVLNAIYQLWFGLATMSSPIGTSSKSTFIPELDGLIDVNSSATTYYSNNTTFLSSPSYLPTPNNSTNAARNPDSVLDSPTLLRTFYVLMAVTGIIVVYFVVRTVRLRCRDHRKRRYGLLSTHDDGLEMRRLEEDDDDDATVFDRMQAKSRR